MTREDYNHYKKELLERKTEPKAINNKELAEDFYNLLIAEYPKATMFCVMDTQYICLDERAAKKLYKIIKGQIEVVQNTLTGLEQALEAIERDVQK